MRIKLYDIEKKDYPNERGDSFRTLQVFRCWVCKSLTNRVVMGGYPGYGVRTICPNASECWHHELERKKKWLDKPHPHSYKMELLDEINELFYSLKYKEIKNDIKGNPDYDKELKITNTFATRIEDPCSCSRYK